MKARKLFALLLAVVMIFALSVTAFATEGGEPAPEGGGTEGETPVAAPTSGSITVNPNYDKQTYTLYKLFDAHITFDAEGKQQAITYTLPEGKTLGEDNKWFELNENGFVVAKEGLAEDWAKDPEAIAWAKSFGTQVQEPIKADSDNDAKVKWDGLDFGYYFVTTTLGSFIGVDTNNPDATIKDKNEKPSIDKEITGVNGEGKGNVFDASEDGEKTDVGEGKNEQAIAQIGDTVSYKLTIKVKPGAKNYVITDTMTNLALVASSVKVDGELYSASTKVDNTTEGATVITDGADNFKITLSQAWLDKVTEETEIVITYDAILTKDAYVADEANPNTGKLTWGDNPDDNYSEDQSKVWTAKVNVEKKINDENGEPLSGAGFVLKNSENKYYKLGDDGLVTWVDKEDDATVLTTNAEGKLDTEFKGLANGTYTLIEKVVPAGYNKLEDTTIEIKDSDVTKDNLAQTKTVINKAGTELPSTGGIGTTLFYVAGGILVVAALVLLVARKRMSAEG